ncbi:restriction endonuclease subunit S [bacterium]|nr:restriction endonuclease subunit S [bacterium]
MNDLVSLGDLFDFKNGRAFKKSEWSDSGLPIIRIQNLNNESAAYNYFEGQYNQAIEIDNNDLLFSWSGTVGSSFGPHIWERGKGVLNQHIYKIVNKSQIDKRYAYYALLEITSEIEASVNGAVGLVHVTKTDLKKFEIPVPSPAEQERIVGVLDEAFEGIATATAQAEKNLQNARELFQSVLQSTFSQKGDDWVEATLNEVCLEFGRGKSKHRPRNDKTLYGGDYPFIQTGDIRNSGHLIISYTQTYNDLGLSQSRLWPKGTVCITIAANIAETGILDFEACFPDSVIGLVVNPEKTSNSYIEYMLQYFKVKLQAEGKGSTQDNINLATFKSHQFPFAPLDMQQAIVEKLDALSEETKRLEAIYQRKLDALAELKQSLLQRAFTGQI